MPRNYVKKSQRMKTNQLSNQNDNFQPLNQTNPDLLQVANQNQPQTITDQSPIPSELSDPALKISGSDLGTDHLESVVKDAFVNEASTQQIPQAGIDHASPIGPVMDRPTFQKSFSGLFNFGGAFFPSLKIRPEEIEQADNASSALYDCAIEVEWLRFLIQPGNLWAQRIIVIGMFVLPKAQGLRNDIVARRASQLAAHAQREPKAEAA